jgi:hypothetical protein
LVNFVKTMLISIVEDVMKDGAKSTEENGILEIIWI